jgi:serine/threonine-protein kinase
MSDVFVSYKAEDQRRVRPLIDALEAEGLSVWWDAEIGGGAAWRQSIEEELDAARCVIVVWSKRSAAPEGTFVHDEASRAMERRVYLPVKIDNVRPPLGFGERQALTLNRWQGKRDDPRYQAVLCAVRAIMEGKTPQTLVHSHGVGFDRRAVVAGGAVVIAGLGGRIALRPNSAAATRIAVLPFANLSGDPSQAYFSDGLAEELRTALSRITELKVVARTSSEKVRDDDIPTAAHKLDVSAIVTGSVRRSPSTVRVDAQLVDGSDGAERWSEAYDRSAGDALQIQSEIAQKVASALSIQLGQAERATLTAGGTNNPTAHDILLQVERDRDSDNLDGVERKLTLVDAALSHDPNYAEAYAAKAFLLMVKAGIHERSMDAARRGFAEALATASRAIAIAPKMAVGHAVRALVHSWRLEIPLAWADIRRAVALPGGENVDVLNIYAALFSQTGRSQEALRLNAKAISLDPLNPRTYAERADILYAARRYSEAEISARHTLQLAPNSFRGRSTLGLALLAQGKSAEAEIEFRRLDPDIYLRAVGEATIMARQGLRSADLDKLRTLQSNYGDAAHYQYGQIYAQLGMTDDAFRELGRAWQLRDAGLSGLRVDEFLDPIRTDPRFAALEQKLGYP